MITVYVCISACLCDGGLVWVLKGKGVESGSVRWWGMITEAKGGETDGRGGGRKGEAG